MISRVAFCDSDALRIPAHQGKEQEHADDLNDAPACRGGIQ
jgi:hypothetical protein